MAEIQQVLQELNRRLSTLEVKDAIWTFMCRYCKVCDEHDWEAFGNMFAEDGIMEYGPWGPIQGPANIAKATSAEKIFAYQEHSLSNMSIEVISPDEAKATSLFTFYGCPDLEAPFQYCAKGGVYNLHFRRLKEEWKIVRHHLSPGWSHGEKVTEDFAAAVANIKK
ncbi:hypothetical protein BO82DRAFT_359228 [Aspergillus uvarum CBS 121591]|uniref:SnoaL-like domain-containing protein n=1 Tax=Aspergillus uvarum CBS 121591 TaxID=1448315 RepID=A0A319BVU3_9EURO|nr:hypothetical protein BO82DRAFT_359228 [Aspergillus uvarum CBS 121591]PYH76347.1 hypothetical protein BO82DRAFT_359228 [Aspergillus uvarum CBS 121591]